MPGVTPSIARCLLDRRADALHYVSAEQHLVTGPILLLRPREGHPADVDEVAPVDVVIGGIAAPGTAAERERLRHPVPQVAAVGLALRLPHHDPRGLGGVRELHDVVLVVRVDAAGVTAALVTLVLVGDRDG